MDRGHDAVADAVGVVDDLHQGGQAVGGAGGVGNYVHVGLVVQVVHTHDEGGRFVGRRGDDDLFRAAQKMLGGILHLLEFAGGLNDVLSARFRPGDLRRIVAVEDPDLLPVDDQAVVGVGDLAGISAEHGVVLEQVRQQLRLLVVVDRLEGETAQLLAGPDRQAADPSEPVDTHIDTHSVPPKSYIFEYWKTHKGPGMPPEVFFPGSAAPRFSRAGYYAIMTA